MKKNFICNFGQTFWWKIYQPYWNKKTLTLLLWNIYFLKGLCQVTKQQRMTFFINRGIVIICFFYLWPCITWYTVQKMKFSIRISSVNVTKGNPSPSEDLLVKKNHTLQNILKFQNVKFECLHTYIWILNENIRIWD